MNPQERDQLITRLRSLAAAPPRRITPTPEKKAVVKNKLEANILKIVSLILLVLCTGCNTAKNPAFWAALAQAQQPSPAYNPKPTYAPVVKSFPSVRKLMLFGGENHQTYLGCVNCPRDSVDSIFNKYGPHGSEFENESIFNPYSDYGSRYSLFSPWNEYASDPPVIVDQNGKFYGAFTINRYAPNRTTDPSLIDILERINNVIK